MSRKIELNRENSSAICSACSHKTCCSTTTTPFLTKKEKMVYDIKSNGKCNKLKKDGKCSIYSNRPIDCRLFPIHIQKIGSKFYWIINKKCSLSKIIDVKKEVDKLERSYLEELKQELNDYEAHPCDKWFEEVEPVRRVKT